MLRTLAVSLCAIMALTQGVHARNDMRGYTCRQVRQAVVQYGGPENAEALARAQGGTEREIAAARRCLVRPRHFRWS